MLSPVYSLLVKTLTKHKFSLSLSLSHKSPWPVTLLSDHPSLHSAIEGTLNMPVLRPIQQNQMKKQERKSFRMTFKPKALKKPLNRLLC
jgi:hypothetical protein